MARRGRALGGVVEGGPGPALLLANLGAAHARIVSHAPNQGVEYLVPGEPEDVVDPIFLALLDGLGVFSRLDMVGCERSAFPLRQSMSLWSMRARSCRSIRQPVSSVERRADLLAASRWQVIPEKTIVVHGGCGARRSPPRFCPRQESCVQLAG
jgi:hypothetical protein